MKTPEFGPSFETAVNPEKETAHELAISNEEGLKFDSVTIDKNEALLKGDMAYKHRIEKDLKSTEFALLSMKDNLNEPAAKMAFANYQKLIAKYERIYGTYTTQINDVGEMDTYTESLHPDMKKNTNVTDVDIAA